MLANYPVKSEGFVSNRWCQHAVIALLGLQFMALCGVSGPIPRQAQPSSQKTQPLQTQPQQIKHALFALPAAVDAQRQDAPREDDTTLLARALLALDASNNLPPGTIARELPAYVESQILPRGDISEIERAHAYFLLGDHAKAEVAARRAFEGVPPPPPPASLTALLIAGQSATGQEQNKKALALFSHGNHVEAEVQMRAVVAFRERVLGPWHLGALANRHNLAVILTSQGKHGEAEAEYRSVIAIQNRALGPEHPETLRSRSNLANVLDSMRNHAAAEAEYRAVVAIRQRVLGPEHPDTLKSRNNLANTLIPQGKHAEAEAECRALLAIQERVHGDEHSETLRSCYNLSMMLAQKGRRSDAMVFARRASVGWNKALGADHPLSKAAKQLLESLENEEPR